MYRLRSKVVTVYYTCMTWAFTPPREWKLPVWRTATKRYVCVQSSHILVNNRGREKGDGGYKLRAREALVNVYLFWHAGSNQCPLIGWDVSIKGSWCSNGICTMIYTHWCVAALSAHTHTHTHIYRSMHSLNLGGYIWSSSVIASFSQDYKVEQVNKQVSGWELIASGRVNGAAHSWQGDESRLGPGHFCTAAAQQ